MHGYHARGGHRLQDQARTLAAPPLHHDTRFLTGSAVLELGCGVGAQWSGVQGQKMARGLTGTPVAPRSRGGAMVSRKV